MNYAALLALLAALAFVLPFLVNLAEGLGVPRGFSIMTTLAAAVFLVAWGVVRERVTRRQELEERIAEVQRKCRASSGDPAAFLSRGEHLGDLLIEVGRPREALRVFDAYRRALLAAERSTHDIEATEAMIAALRLELAEEDKDASL